MSTITSADFLLTAEHLRARSATKWNHYPVDVLPAWVADMDFAVAPPVQEVLARLVERQDYGYGAWTTFDELRALFAHRMSDRYGWQVDPELVELTTDVVQGIVAAIAAYSAFGEGVVAQTPVYPPFLRTIEATGRRLVENRLLDDGSRFEVDLEDLARAVDAETRLILLCNPHNPTGRVLDRAELEGIGRLAVERDLVIVADEIHSDLVYPGARHLPIATLAPEIAERTLTLTSATKAFNIAGVRCAVAHFGSPELLARFRAAIPDHLLGRPSTFGVEATLAAWRSGQPWLDAVLAYLEGNRSRVSEWAAREASALGYHQPEGTYLAWFDCSGIELGGSTPHEFFLEAARVGLSAGADFGTPGVGCIRVNFATSAEILDQVLDRMAEAFMT